MPQEITFQLATHFLPKIALHLECLYKTIDQACGETHPVIHHYALKNIIEIIKIIEKPELKSRFLKELMRINHALNKSNATINAELCERLIKQTQVLTQVTGLFGEKIHHEPFLQSIRINQSVHNNDFDMYPPQLLLWLESEAGIRQRDLAIWLSHLRELYATVGIYLQLLRDCAQFDSINTFNGFYQRPLPPKTICHLIILRIDKNSGIVPHMQLGHYGFSLRLCEAASMRAVRETNAKLELGICQL